MKLWQKLGIAGLLATASITIGLLGGTDIPLIGEEAPPPVDTVLAELSDVKDRANVKAALIRKEVGNEPRTNVQFSGSNVDIEIVGMKQFDGGIAVFARAWDSEGDQIGFGPDGTVDVERFVIYNPFVLVDDPLGDIVKSATDSDGKPYELKQREDPKQALLNELAHTIKLKKQKFGPENIVPGKVGNTTATINPDGDPETNTSDGGVATDGGASRDWATQHADTTGEFANSDRTTFTVPGHGNGPVIRNYGSDGSRVISIVRMGASFDTSVVSGTIDTATFSLYVTGKGDVVNDSYSYMSVVGYSPASDTDFANGDIDSFGTTEYHDSGQRKDITGISTSAYLDWTLNATGIAAIDTEGISYMGIRVGSDITNNEPATFNAGISGISNASSAEAGSNPPKLVIEYTPDSSPPIIFFTSLLDLPDTKLEALVTDLIHA